MSLLSSGYEPFVMMDKTTVPDGYGGFRPAWRDGAEFEAHARFDSSMEARVGAVQGVTSLFTITTSRAVNLQYHDICKRLSDNKIFRVTSDGDDNKTPRGAGLDMRQVTAEEWELIDNG